MTWQGPGDGKFVLPAGAYPDAYGAVPTAAIEALAQAAGDRLFG